MIVDELFPIYGAIAGDMVGAPYELKGTRIKDIRFPIVKSNSLPTDDTIQTVAMMKWVTTREFESEDLVDILKTLCLKYPNAGYGHSYKMWLRSLNSEPYNSFGNGSAMRVAPIAVCATSINDVLELAQKSAEITHNHPEGIKGAQAVAAATYLAYHGFTKSNIREFVSTRFGYNLNDTIENIRKTYSFDSSCQGSVPQAIIAFLESVDFEDAIRLAVSLGGDADTQASIAGAIAGAFYKDIPCEIINWVHNHVISEFKEIEPLYIETLNDLKSLGHQMCLITKRDMYMRGCQTYTFAATDFRYTYVPSGTRLYIDLKNIKESKWIPCKVLSNQEIISKQFIEEANVIAPGEIESLYSAGIYISSTQFDEVKIDIVNPLDINP
jgi:ADP-ribosylglycohydrolase